MATFALVHGAWHGAWSWERLKPELEDAGHRVAAVDLPCEDPQATFSEYADVVVESLEGVGDDVVVVGHSLAGHTIPLVAARRPVRRLVYLCALIALPGRSFVEQLKEAGMPILLPDYEAGMSEIDEQGRRRWVDFEIAWSEMYGDCDEATARAAFDRLRLQDTAPYRVPCPLEALPAVETVYMMGSEDRMVNPDWSRRVAPERLGVEPVELAGSHSPMIARPRELAELLRRGL
jgi:pimeloyl-ACP methyl ester carboxylesterase